LRIYCDTNTLFSNITNEPAELAALQAILADYQAGRIVMYRSLVDLREVMNTPNASHLQKLIADYEVLEPIPKDEKLYGFHTQTDQYGGFALTRHPRTPPGVLPRRTNTPQGFCGSRYRRRSALAVAHPGRCRPRSATAGPKV
jgi:hypothetical protein